jgi:TRAP-type mannitol/chloroaromatic compound transport system permease small subunit
MPLHVSVHIYYDYLQVARKQYFVQLLSWIPLMYVCCVFVQYAAVCHYLLSYSSSYSSHHTGVWGE